MHPVIVLGCLRRWADLHLCVLQAADRKEPCPPCPRTPVPIEAPLTPEQSLLTDHIGNEVYASHYAERKAYRLVIGCGTVLLCGSMWLNFSLAHRPIANRYIRIDEMGRAQAIQYSDLNYSPREGEVRTYLTDWANYRYTINRDTIAKKYPLNYYFLSQSARFAVDGRRQPESSCLAGHGRTDRAERCGGAERDHHVDVRRDGPGRAIARGTALVAIDQALLRQTTPTSRAPSIGC